MLIEDMPLLVRQWWRTDRDSKISVIKPLISLHIWVLRIDSSVNISVTTEFYACI